MFQDLYQVPYRISGHLKIIYWKNLWYPPFQQSILRIMENPRIETMEIEGEDFLYILDSRHKGNYTMDYHRHDFFELTFVVEGNGICQELKNGERRKHDMHRDYVILRDGRIPHRTQDAPGSPLEQLIVIFDDAYMRRVPDHGLVLEALKDGDPLILTDPLYTRQLKPLFREILKEMRDRSGGKDSQVLALLIRLLVLIIRAGEQNRKLSSRDLRIERVLEHMRQNFFLNLNLPAAAELSNLSQRQFSDLFKKETGKTFTEYLNGIRIERAKEALKDSSLSITEIAFEIGYDDLSYFTRRFKAAAGMTPRAYRKQFR